MCRRIDGRAPTIERQVDGSRPLLERILARSAHAATSNAQRELIAAISRRHYGPTADLRPARARPTRTDSIRGLYSARSTRRRGYTSWALLRRHCGPGGPPSLTHSRTTGRNPLGPPCEKFAQRPMPTISDQLSRASGEIMDVLYRLGEAGSPRCPPADRRIQLGAVTLGNSRLRAPCATVATAPASLIPTVPRGGAESALATWSHLFRGSPSKAAYPAHSPATRFSAEELTSSPPGPRRPAGSRAMSASIARPARGTLVRGARIWPRRCGGQSCAAVCRRRTPS